MIMTDKMQLKNVPLKFKLTGINKIENRFSLKLSY